MCIWFVCAIHASLPSWFSQVVLFFCLADSLADGCMWMAGFPVLSLPARPVCGSVAPGYVGMWLRMALGVCGPLARRLLSEGRARGGSPLSRVSGQASAVCVVWVAGPVVLTAVCSLMSPGGVTCVISAGARGVGAGVSPGLDSVQGSLLSL